MVFTVDSLELAAELGEEGKTMCAEFSEELPTETKDRLYVTVETENSACGGYDSYPEMEAWREGMFEAERGKNGVLDGGTSWLVVLACLHGTLVIFPKNLSYNLMYRNVNKETA